MTVDEAVREEVFSVETDTPVEAIVEQMDEFDVGSAIVEEDGRPTGIVTDRSIALALVEDPDIVERTAGDIADDDVVTVMEGTTLSEVLAQMNRESIRRLPVVDENGDLSGIVTLDDVIVLLAPTFATVAETIEGQFPEL